MIVIQIPMSIMKNISTLQYISIFTLICITYTLLVIVIEFPFYYTEFNNDNPSYEIHLFPERNWNWLSTLGPFLFGFSNHNALFDVINELKRPNSRRTIKLINSSTILLSIFYLLIILTGYLSFFDKVEDTLITRQNLKSFPNDYLIEISKWALVFCLNCCCAINYNIMRQSYNILLFNGSDGSFKIDFLIVVLTYTITNLVVYVTSSIIEIFGLIGGVSTVVISFICPIVIDIRLGNHKKTSFRYIFNIFFLVIMTILGIGITTKALIEYF
jgi:amino acid permease